MKAHFHQRRHIALLEVLICFALIALCILPLIYPHVAILKSEKDFVNTIELDHAVNLLYANVLQKLYLREISWADIENGKEIPIDENLLHASGVKKFLPFTGSYKFVEIKHKPPKQPEDSVYLYSLVFTFSPTLKKALPYVYKYQIVIERKQK